MRHFSFRSNRFHRSGTWALATLSGTIRRCCRGSGGRRLRHTGARGSPAPCPTRFSTSTTTRTQMCGRASRTTSERAHPHCSWQSSSNGATAGRAFLPLTNILSPTIFILLFLLPKSHNWTYARIISLSSFYGSSETTTFQLTLATDGVTTWTLFQYAYPSTINEYAYYPQQVGYYSGNDRAIVYSKNWWSPYYYYYTTYSYTPTYNPATAVGNSMLVFKFTLS